jgi:spoIIIJ-associated protein
MLRLEPDDHDRVSFDANGFKASRARALRTAADEAIAQVKDTGEPFRFRPMNSRERRMLHLFLRDSGLQTASSGEGPRRFVVLYPEGYRIPAERSYEGPERRGRPRHHVSSGSY